MICGRNETLNFTRRSEVWWTNIQKSKRPRRLWNKLKTIETRDHSNRAKKMTNLSLAGNKTDEDRNNLTKVPDHIINETMAKAIPLTPDRGNLKQEAIPLTPDRDNNNQEVILLIPDRGHIKQGVILLIPDRGHIKQ
jgi:hypothetical protein